MNFNIVLYYNEQHQLTEFNLGNIVISENDKFYTPSEQTGILNGVMRQSLLDDGTIEEKDYSVDDFIEKYKNGRISLFHLIEFQHRFIFIYYVKIILYFTFLNLLLYHYSFLHYFFQFIFIYVVFNFQIILY